MIRIALVALAVAGLGACTADFNDDVAIVPQPAPVVVNSGYSGYGYGPVYGTHSVVVGEPDFETIDDSRGVFEGDFGLD